MVYDNLVVAGGSAGHVFPAIVLAGQENHHLLLEKKSKLFYQSYSNEVTNIFYFSMERNVFSVIKNIFSLFFLVSKYKKVILMGSSYCFPVFIIAIILRKEIIIYEQNAILGMANYIFSFFAKEIHTSFNISNSLTYTYSGMPMLINKYEIKQKKIILLLSGSRGSVQMHQFLKTIYQYAEIHKYKLYGSIKDAHTYQTLYPNSILKDFFKDFEYLISCASLIICHGGASTISFINMYNKPCILIPLDHSVANHQIYNCVFSGLPFIREDSIVQSVLTLEKFLNKFNENPDAFRSKWLCFKNNYIHQS